MAGKPKESGKTNCCIEDYLGDKRVFENNYQAHKAARKKMMLCDSEVIAALEKSPESIFNGNESAYEKYVVSVLPEIFAELNLPAIEKIETQVFQKVGSFRIILDIYVLHCDNSVSILEAKCSKITKNNHGVAAQAQAQSIGQLLLYKGVVEELRKTRFGDSKVRLFLVDQKILPRTVCIFSQCKLPITLLEVSGDRVFIPFSGDLS